jgi:hypothetical protein
VTKAEADYDAILLLLKSRKARRHDTIWFHCPHCVEKYLKGRLIEGPAFASPKE